VSRVYFCDFDGVIIDSIMECYEVSFLACGDVSPDLKIRETTLRKLFYKYRGLVGHPSEYLILFNSINSHIINDKIIVPAHFKLLLKNYDKDILKNFEKSFFDRRKKLQVDLESWLNLHKLFPFGNYINNLKIDFFNIVTTKDRESVFLLLNHFKIKYNEVFDISDYNKMGSKGAIISSYMNSTDCERACFIDDSIKHLQTVDDKRVELFFADWGYGNNHENNPFKCFQFL
jgi:hypothetical protein